MLIAHELAHVVQQSGRRTAAPLPGEPLWTGLGSAHGSARTEADADGAALAVGSGASVAVSSSAPVGIARAEKGWFDKLSDQAGQVYDEGAAKLKEKARDRVKEGLGAVEGVLLEGGNIVDTLAWVPYAQIDAVDWAVDKAAAAGSLSPAGTAALREAAHALANDNAALLKPTRQFLKDKGFTDETTGAPAISGHITKLGNVAETWLDESVFTGMPKEEGLFSWREIGQIEGCVAAQGALSEIGVEEVQLALKVLGALESVKSVVTTVQKAAREGKKFYATPDFWMAVGGAVLSVVGLSGLTGKRKLLNLFVEAAGMTLGLAGPVVSYFDHLANYNEPDRDTILHQDLIQIAKAGAQVMRQVMTHAVSNNRASQGTAGQGAPGNEAPPTNKPGQKQPAPESKPAVKPAVKTLDEPAAKAPPKTQAATTPADEPAAKPAAKPAAPKAVKAAADEGQPQSAAKVAQTTDEAHAAAPSAVIDDLNLDQAFTPWEGKKSPGKPRSVEAAGKRVAKAKEKVENATSDQSSARERVASETEKVDQARKTLNEAKAAARKAAADYKKAPPGARQAPRSEDTKARKAVRDAEAKLDRAKADAKKATAASKTADKQLAKAQARHADSEKALAAATKAKADREALAAAKAGRDEGKKARAEWSENQRADQAKTLGAHSHEQLHHAIELDVLDRYPGVFSKRELLDIANIRVIPLELRPSQRKLLSKAVAKGNVENPGAVKGIKFDQVAQPDGSTAPRPTVTSRGAKDRPSQLHQSAIRRLLDRGYAALDQEVSAAQAKGKLAPGSPEYKAFVRKRIEGLRDEVDHLYGGLFGQARQEAGLRGPNQAQSRAREPAEPAAGNRPVRPFVAFPGVAGQSEKDAEEERQRAERAEQDRRAAELNARNKDQEDQP